MRVFWAAFTATMLSASCALPGDTGGPAIPGPTERGVLGDPPPPGARPSNTMLRLVKPPFDATSTAEMIARWPALTPGIHAHATTSFDRSGGNDDGFAGTYSTLGTIGHETLIFDELGPGVVRTLWLTSFVDGDSPLSLGQLHFYFDDDESSRIDIDADALFAGKTSPFLAPLVAANHASSGGFASWTPLSFAKRLRITSDKRVGFYQIHWDSLPADWDVASLGTDPALAARFSGGPSTATLEAVSLNTTRTGSGTIDALRFVPDTAPTDDELRSARIQIWFDGATDPQVDVPFGFFFGSGRGLARVSSVAWTMTPTLLESRLPMPFWEGFHILVTGIAGALSLHVGDEVPRASNGTLETRFSSERPTSSGDHVYADVTGTGKIVATVLGIDPIDAANKQWWEGDMRTRVDDLRSPSIHGTGHEDDHLGGWSNEFLSRPFSLPMQGCPRTDLLDTRAEFQVNGATTMYRLWPGIPFYRSIRHSTEHGTGNGRTLNYESATFLYRQAKTRLVKSDAKDDFPSSYSLTSAFEGELGDSFTKGVARFTGPVTFSLAIDPKNDGVELRRLFDHEEHATEATRLGIEVDGLLTTAVSIAKPYAPSRRWAEQDIFLPAQITKGKSKIELRVTPSSSFTAASFETWSVLSE